MATELDSRIWIEQEIDAKEQFLSLINIISKSPICSNQWQNLIVNNKVSGIKVLEKKDYISLDDIASTISSINGETYRFTIYVPIKCWRFSDTKIEDAHIMMAISCWGKEFGKSVDFDFNIEANAQISILNVGPYCAIDENEESAKHINNKVEENIERYISLIQSIILGIKPQKILTFSDAGDYIISNTHMAFFENYTELKSSLLLFQEILKFGNLNYEITSLEKADIKRNSWFFHEWRNTEQRNNLKEKLSIVAKNSSVNVCEDKIRNVLNSGKYDYFDLNESILLLNYPWFLNAFLDSFFIEILSS